MLVRILLAGYVVLIVVVTVLSLPDDHDELATARQAEQAARYLIGPGTVEPARRDNDRWEVDVRRPDGSLVQLTFDDNLELRGYDDELGPGGTLAHDEVTGPLRHKAILAAIEEAGPGNPIGVERDGPDEIEVGLRKPDGTQVEVTMDNKLRVARVLREDPGDE